MDNSQKIFILSLKQDLQKLNQLLTELPENNNKQEKVTSWLFPTKNYTFVDEFIITRNILHHGSEGLILQLIIDRIYVGIKLLLQQIEIYPIRQFVFSPKQVTLGSLFRNLCKSVVQMKESITTIDITEERSTISKVNRESQTDILSANKCDSCASAIMCMKNLINVFENKDFDYVTEGRQFKPQILNITQFGSMLQATTTVIDNFKYLNEKYFDKEEEIRNLKKENEAALIDLSKTKRKINHMEEEARMYKTEFEKCTQKITKLSYEIEDLNNEKVQKDLRIAKLESIVENLNKIVHKREILIENLQREKKIFKKNLQYTAVQQKVLLDTVLLLNQNLEKSIGNIELISHTLVQFEENIDILNGKLSNISKINESTILKVMNLKRISEHRSDNYQEFRNQWKVKLTYFFEKIRDKSGNTVTQSFKIKGNPVEDLTTQIQENEIKINKFRLENEKLSKLLTKFQRFKPACN